MSFSKDVKQELFSQISKKRHCRIAELAAMILFDGRDDEKKAAPYVLFETENPDLIQKYFTLVEKTVTIGNCGGVSEAQEKEVVPMNTEKVVRQEILETIKWDPARKRAVDGQIIQQPCCKRAFIRGAYLTTGSMSDPSKAYHFEIVCQTREQAKQLQTVMNTFVTDAKIVQRKNHYVVYLKEGEQISDMLSVMEAHKMRLDFENVRIVKEMRNSVNRQVNCETANIEKTVNAAVRQIEDIKWIESQCGLESLPENLREMARLRIENPEMPLKDLGTLLVPPVGKSGVNHRLRRISEIADKLRI